MCDEVECQFVISPSIQTSPVLIGILLGFRYPKVFSVALCFYMKDKSALLLFAVPICGFTEKEKL